MLPLGGSVLSLPTSLNRPGTAPSVSPRVYAPARDSGESRREQPFWYVKRAAARSRAYCQTEEACRIRHLPKKSRFVNTQQLNRPLNCGNTVPEVGLEPTHLSIPHFECGASANSATRARRHRLS